MNINIKEGAFLYVEFGKLEICLKDSSDKKTMVRGNWMYVLPDDIPEINALEFSLLHVYKK